jgi:hypothetical protein
MTLSWTAAGKPILICRWIFASYVTDLSEESGVRTRQNELDGGLVFELWAPYVATSSLVVGVSLGASQYSYTHVWTLWNTLLHSNLSFLDVMSLRWKYFFGQPCQRYASQRPVSSTTRTHRKSTAIALKNRLYQKEFLVKIQVPRDVTLCCRATFSPFLKRQQIRHSSWTAWARRQK